MNKKGSKTAVEPIYNPDDVKAIGAYLKEEDERREQPAYLIWLLCLVCGYRIGDVLRLRIGNVLTRGKKIRDYLEFREEKTEKAQKRKILPEVKAELEKYIERKDWKKTKYQSYLFESERVEGKPYTYQWMNERLKDARIACNIEQRITTHTMRKTFAYNFYMAHKDNRERFTDPDACLSYLSKTILKHASVDITRRYIGIEQDQSKVDELIAGAVKNII